VKYMYYHWLDELSEHYYSPLLSMEAEGRNSCAPSREAGNGVYGGLFETGILISRSISRDANIVSSLSNDIVTKNVGLRAV